MRFTKKEELTEEQKGDDRDKRIAHLEQELINLRKITLETAQGTIVHGLGAGSPGSGEVNLNRMDDVDVRGIVDGASLIWDEELNKWIPSSSAGASGGIQVPTDILNKLNNLENALISLQAFVQEHAGDLDFHPNAPHDETHDHTGMVELLTMESGTDDTGARTVDIDDDSTAFIVTEGSVDLDHFHYLEDGLLLIEVEGTTQFEITDHEHDPVWTEMEAYSDFYGVARDLSGLMEQPCCCA